MKQYNYAIIFSSVVVSICLNLTACQSTHPVYQKKSVSDKSYRALDEQDGAPKGPIPTHFKEIKLINAPLSRYGNPMMYVVNGLRYHVLTSATGYRTRGLASWYGTKFHNRRTSSGEEYNMYALTAAHKTLPLPTYLKVKNLDNGRVAIVKVNDRGPFHSERIIDLSYAAAAKLGVFPKGTAHVEIEALEMPGSKRHHVAHYYLQAGAFAQPQRAESLREQLRRLTPSPVFVAHEQQHFLVRVGPFASQRMMQSLKKTLAQHGVKNTFSLLF